MQVSPAISPLAEELVCVCVFEPIGGEDSVTLLRGPIHSAAGLLFRRTPPWEHILRGERLSLNCLENWNQHSSGIVNERKGAF